MIFGHAISAQQLFGQLLIGLINGSFYALLSLGLAVIFGMLNIVNFAHGALLHGRRVRRLFPAARPGPQLLVGAHPVAVDRRRVRRGRSSARSSIGCAGLDPLYGLLLTFGLALVIQGLFQNYFGASGMPYAIPPAVVRRAQSRLHVPAELSRLGDRLLGGRVSGDLVH